MSFLHVKALHIIFVVTWFAGLFYIVRLFVYQREAQDKSSDEQRILNPQFALMAKRLWYGITWPSAVITLVLGALILYTAPGYLQQGWMHVKLSLVLGLYIYHGICHSVFLKLQRQLPVWTSTKFRIWNEVATIFLVAIVFLVVLKNTLDMAKGLFGLVVFTLVLMLGIQLYKKVRKQ
ncbi:MAG: CopD family protein [Schleiferiaceae bacterium]|nr:CopD family protein [Schleiferiaceae bacterium]